MIQTQVIETELPPGDTITSQFQWDTTGSSLGEHVLTASQTLTDAVDDNAANDSAEAIVTITSTPLEEKILYVTLFNDGAVGGLSVTNHDIVAFDGIGFSVVFDASRSMDFREPTRTFSGCRLNPRSYSTGAALDWRATTSRLPITTMVAAGRVRLPRRERSRDRRSWIPRL